MLPCRNYVADGNNLGSRIKYQTDPKICILPMNKKFTLFAGFNRK